MDALIPYIKGSFTDEGLHPLTKLPLKMLFLSQSFKMEITDNGLVQLFSSYKDLRVLGLHGCLLVAGENIQCIEKLPLTHLVLSHVDITDIGFQNFLRCKSLQHVSVTKCSKVTNAIMPQLARLPLQSLSFNDMQINDEGVDLLTQTKEGENESPLKGLQLCYSITVKSFTYLDRLKNLSHFSISPKPISLFFISFEPLSIPHEALKNFMERRKLKPFQEVYPSLTTMTRIPMRPVEELSIKK